MSTFHPRTMEVIWLGARTGWPCADFLSGGLWPDGVVPGQVGHGLTFHPRAWLGQVGRVLTFYPRASGLGPDRLTAVLTFHPWALASGCLRGQVDLVLTFYPCAPGVWGGWGLGQVGLRVDFLSVSLRPWGGDFAQTGRLESAFDL